jgi:hypothetical protein
MRKDVANTFNVFRAAYFLTLLYTYPLFRMSETEEPILPPAEEPSLTDDNVVDPNAAPAGAETPESVPVPDGAEGTPVPAGAGSPAEGATQKPWYQFWGGKRKSRKQSRKQKGGKKSKSRGGNKKSRKQKRSAKNKRA